MEKESDKKIDRDIAWKKRKTKIEVYGEEIIERIVKPSGNSGRIYLPPSWIGRHVKIIKVED